MFKFDPGLCSACGACAVACMDQNDMAPSDTPYRTVGVTEAEDGPLSFFSAAGRGCNGCAVRLQNGLLPACVHTCPTGALAAAPEVSI